MLRSLFLLVVVLAIVLGILVITTGPSHAHTPHGTHDTIDRNYDSNNIITYYKADRFGPTFSQGMDTLRHLHDIEPNAPDWRLVHDVARAEVVFQIAPRDNFFRRTYPCGNSTYLRPGTDTIYLDPQCQTFYGAVRHEAGAHGLGMYHQPCGSTPPTVSFPSCNKPYGWSKHDRNYVENIPKGN